MDTNKKSKKCSGCLDCSNCKGNHKNIILEIPKMKEILHSDLVKILDIYDQILINHIVTHYYDGQITEDILKKIKEKLKENKKKIYN
jgi:hypothetical protein